LLQSQLIKICAINCARSAQGMPVRSAASALVHDDAITHAVTALAAPAVGLLGISWSALQQLSYRLLVLLLVSVVIVN
jgi:hypothetical protein